jgi:hypothetical protein
MFNKPACDYFALVLQILNNVEGAASRFIKLKFCVN